LFNNLIQVKVFASIGIMVNGPDERKKSLIKNGEFKRFFDNFK
jgi:hypothetical protein